MNLSTVLAGKKFSFRSVKEVLAKANEEKSGDILAGMIGSFLAQGMDHIRE